MKTPKRQSNDQGYKVLVVIDPSTVCPVLCHMSLTDKKPTHKIMHFSFRTDKDRQNTICDLFNFARDIGPGVLLIEDQIMVKNIHSTKQLAQAAGNLDAPFRMNGWQVEYINPGKWQSDMLGINIRNPVAGPARKHISINRAQLLTGETIKNHNVADAICMAFWYRNNYEGRQNIERLSRKHSEALSNLYWSDRR